MLMLFRTQEKLCQQTAIEKKIGQVINLKK
jgi:hypothetical protein